MFLSFVQVSFGSSDICVLFGKAHRGQEITKESWEGISSEGNRRQCYKRLKGNNGTKGVK